MTTAKTLIAKISVGIFISSSNHYQTGDGEFPNTKARHPVSLESRHKILLHRMSLKSSFSFVKPFLFNYFGRILLPLRFLVLNTFDYKNLFPLIYAQLFIPN